MLNRPRSYIMLCCAVLFLLLFKALTAAQTADSSAVSGAPSPSAKNSPPAAAPGTTLGTFKPQPFLRFREDTTEAWLVWRTADGKRSDYAFRAESSGGDGPVDLISIRTPEYVVIFVYSEGRTHVMLKPPVPGITKTGDLRPINDQRITDAFRVGTEYYKEFLKNPVRMVVDSDAQNPLFKKIKAVVEENYPLFWRMPVNFPSLIGRRLSLFFYSGLANFAKIPYSTNIVLKNFTCQQAMQVKYDLR